MLEEPAPASRKASWGGGGLGLPVKKRGRAGVVLTSLCWELGAV